MTSRTLVHESHKIELDAALETLTDTIWEFTNTIDTFAPGAPKGKYWENWESLASSCAGFAAQVKYLSER